MREAERGTPRADMDKLNQLLEQCRPSVPADNPYRLPMLAWNGKPLPRSTVARLLDEFVDLSWACDAIADGRVYQRACTLHLDEDPEAESWYGYFDDYIAITATVKSAGPPEYTYWVSAELNLNDGRFNSFGCELCDTMYEDEEDTEGLLPCCHAAAAALAFLLDPRSFAGCPARLARVGDSYGA